MTSQCSHKSFALLTKHFELGFIRPKKLFSSLQSFLAVSTTQQRFSYYNAIKRSAFFERPQMIREMYFKLFYIIFFFSTKLFYLEK